jgi:transposase
MTDPDRVALFRYEIIAPILDPGLSSAERRAEIELRTRTSALWPDGDDRPVARASLYRWIQAYQQGGLKALRQKPRKDRQVSRVDRSEWVARAVHLLLEREDRSLNFVLGLLALEFEDFKMSRSTLSRELHRHPLWLAIQKKKKRVRRRRTRFEPGKLHDIWYLDGKGSFLVKYRSGKVERITILTILEAVSRAVLSIVISATEHLGAAVSAFRLAAARWGLPDRFYADRHSVYDSYVFRTGLALLGTHRIPTKAGNAEAHGRIEIYHRLLVNWFVKELPHQEVIDREHLLELLQAVIALLYMPHLHRTLHTSPEQRLAGTRSPRVVSTNDLHRAFLVTKRKKAHLKTGEFEIKGRLFLVPAKWAGRKITVRYDPVDPRRVLFVPENGPEIPLAPVTPDPPPKAKEVKRGAGVLQRLADKWQGRELPLSVPGYGLPEIYAALSRALGREVPRTEREAEDVDAFYRGRGPFAPEAFEQALKRVLATLGSNRPLRPVLDALERYVQPPHDPDPEIIA